jgi:HEPN domain-containing protein
MMENSVENKERIIQYWTKSAKRDYRTMQNLLKTGDNSWALFLGHLVLEKLLKAHYVKDTGKHAIFTHDLLRLTAKTTLKPTKEAEDWLDEISTFNLNARYDNYQEDFNALCTNEYTEIWIDRIKTLEKWLTQEL